MAKNDNSRKHPVVAALIPLFVLTGLLLGPAATATAAVPAARQASTAAALPQQGLPAGANVATGLHAPTSVKVQATTGNKKSKKKSKKKSGLFKKLLIVVVVVIALLVVLYVVRRALRRRSA